MWMASLRSSDWACASKACMASRLDRYRQQCLWNRQLRTTTCTTVTSRTRYRRNVASSTLSSTKERYQQLRVANLRKVKILHLWNRIAGLFFAKEVFSFKFKRVSKVIQLQRYPRRIFYMKEIVNTLNEVRETITKEEVKEEEPPRKKIRQQILKEEALPVKAEP